MEVFEVKDYIIRLFRPSCIVFHSASAQKMTQENNLSPAEFLRPFGDFKTEYLTLSTGEKTAIQLKDFALDFYDVSDYEKHPASDNLKARKHILDSTIPVFNINENTKFSISDTQARRTIWYDLWRLTFLELVRVQYSEMICQPLAIFAVVTSEDQIMETLNAILAKKPEVCEQQFEMKDLPKILLILAPSSQEGLMKAGQVYETAKKNLGTNFRVYLCPINSLKFTSEKLIEDIWQPYIKIFKRVGEFESWRSTERGMFVSKGERMKMKEVMLEIFRGTILPYCERKIRTLSISISGKKKTTSIFSKEAAAMAAPADNKPLKADWEVRFAADWAFVMQDYNTAYNMYSKLHDRIKKTNAYVDIGSCREFMALSGLIMNQKNDFYKNMETAFELYYQGNNFNLMTRNGILAYDILVIFKNQYLAGQYLGRTLGALQKEYEIAAMFSEQAGYALIRSSPPLWRKFGHYIVSAGTIYLQSGFLRHAIYCLWIGFNNCEKSNWPEILIYISELLGRMLSDVKDYEFSFVFYRKQLEYSIKNRGDCKQDEQLRAFLKAAEILKQEALKDSSPTAERKINLPEILKMNSILKVLPETIEIFTMQDDIYCNDETKLYQSRFDIARTYEKVNVEAGNAAMGELGEGGVILPVVSDYNKSQDWIILGKMIEGDLSNPPEKTVNPKQKAREELLRDLHFYDERQPKRKAILYTKKKRFIYAFEPVYLKFRVRNPLASVLEISKIFAHCHYLKEQSEEKESKQEEVKIVEADQMKLRFNNDELKELILAIIPKSTGELIIDEISWEISGLVSGTYKLTELTGKPDPIILNVLPSAGNLRLVPDRNFKQKYLEGEIDQYNLLIENMGTTPIERISMHTDYPMLLVWKVEEPPGDNATNKKVNINKKPLKK